ncbi:unnamed protein product [Durusdinium trenchii]|uniref:Protein kinase domain-containing protein n=1 Tax=Durusdinium trenchii TaxID=1381693 RepID=A0ABP0NP51_9DINO
MSKFTGTSNEDCCEKTCVHFPCPHGFRTNVAYAKNTGWSPEACCDQTCETFECAEGYRVTTATAQGVNLTHDTCCSPTCGLHKCGVFWRASEDRSFWVGDSDAVCCEPRCALMQCGLGWALDDQKVDQVGATREECCAKTCEIAQCPQGWRIPESKVKKIARNESECCQPTCEQHVCGKGYVTDATKSDLFMPSNDRCCQKKCAAFECPDGWVRDESKGDLLATNAEGCCIKQCRLHECGAGWLTNTSKNALLGSTDPICCDQTCAAFACAPNTTNRPDVANSTNISCSVRRGTVTRLAAALLEHRPVLGLRAKKKRDQRGAAAAMGGSKLLQQGTCGGGGVEQLGEQVAVIQDQQIPKDEAMKALSGKGFDVSWSLAEPSDAWAIVTARGMRRVQGLQEFANVEFARRGAHDARPERPGKEAIGTNQWTPFPLEAAVKPRLEAGGMPLAYAHALASGAMFPRPGLLPAAALTPGPVLAAQTAAGLATAPGLAGLATLAAAASKAAPAAGLTAPAVLPAALASASSARPAAAAAASATLPAALSAASVPQRDPQEVKQALIHYGCVIPKEAGIRDLQMQLTDFEMHLKRAEATKKIRRHSDQAILACYKDGYSPGHEALVKMLESGIDPDTPSTGTQSGFVVGMTPILAAASWGKATPVEGRGLRSKPAEERSKEHWNLGRATFDATAYLNDFDAATVDDIRLLIAAGADMTARCFTPLGTERIFVERFSTTQTGDGEMVTEDAIAASASVDTGGVDRIHAMLRMIIDADPSPFGHRELVGQCWTPAEWAKHEKKRHHSAFLSSYVGGDDLVIESSGRLAEVVTNPVTKEVLDKHPKCKLVAVSFTGFNHVDLEACKERGISVVNVPAYSTDSVAELSVGLALAVYREIPAGERTLRAGGWVHSSGGMEIRDKVVGIVGLGDIGLRTAELFKAFGPSEILGWSRRPKAAFETLGKQVPIEELFEKSDIVSLHVALNAETQGIIGRSLMERLCGLRVRQMDVRPVSDASDSLDVFATEPIPADDPILKVPADQAVMIPHVACAQLVVRLLLVATLLSTGKEVPQGLDVETRLDRNGVYHMDTSGNSGSTVMFTPLQTWGTPDVTPELMTKRTVTLDKEATNIKLFADGPDSPRERGDMMRASSIDDAAHQGGAVAGPGHPIATHEVHARGGGRQEVRSPPAMSVKIPCGVARSVGDVWVRRFFETGWEEVETLGRGARGPVVSIRRADGRGPISALKRSTHHEVEALKALSNCRNIVELEEIFLCSGQVLARLECMEGGSFRSYLRARPPGRVSEDVVRYVVGQVLEGLQDMHQSGWMHRDVKAENIGLGCELSSWGYRDCTVKLLDFDVAVEVGCGGLSEVIGTVENMAPEVFKGSYNELADIWSVGIITYEALYGYRPFNDANVDRIEEMVRNWQRYLLFPFDAAELPAHFIRLMLADPEERAAAGTVRHHRWLRPGHIESELPATGSGFPNSYRHHPSSKSEGSKVKLHEANCRSRSVKVSTVKLLEGLRDEPKDEIETSFTEWDQDSPSGQAVETLSRLRQGLSMWTNSRFAMVDGTDAADLGQQLGEGAGTSCSLPTRHASRFIPLKSECAEFRTERVPERGARHTDVTGSEAKTESLEDLEASSMVEDDTRDPSADQWHQSYLQRIRDWFFRGQTGW